MQELSPTKQLKIIRLYLGGLSYRSIAKKVAVSTGSIANVVADLKAGKYPEIAEVSDQVDVLKELAADLKKSGLSAAEAVTGISVLHSLHGLGLEPADIQKCVSVCNMLSAASAESQHSFVKAALEYQDTIQKTGLDVLELDTKVKSLEENANLLEPLATKALELQEENEGLEKKREKLTYEVSGFEKQNHILAESIKEKEHRESDLSTRLAHLEDKLQSSEQKLTVARNDLKTLAAIGISLPEFSGIVERLKGISQKHDISPKALYGMLLDELEHLDEELKLDTTIGQKRYQLHDLQTEISQAKEKLAVLKSQNQQLQQELSSIKAQIEDERQIVSVEQKAIVDTTQNAVEELKRGLEKAIEDSLNEVDKLKNQSIELGMEVGRCTALIKSNTFIEDFVALLRGEDTITGSNLRVLILVLLKSTLVWLESHRPEETKYVLLKTNTELLITELGKWQPQLNTSEL